MAKITTPDNGYFQVWTLDCGHTVRVNTEIEGWERRNPAAAARLDAATAARLEAAACKKCDA